MSASPLSRSTDHQIPLGRIGNTEEAVRIEQKLGAVPQITYESAPFLHSI